MSKTVISIIIPCYNQARFLDDALLSVWNQSFVSWECIIVNDGSEDHTPEIAKNWVSKDSRFKYIWQENKGLSAARNAGILISRGEFILPLDADDRIGPDYISKAIEVFNKDNELKIVYCKGEKFGQEIGPLSLAPFSLFNLSRSNMIFCSAVYQKKDWNRVGGYDERMIHGFEDWEFWISIIKGGGKVECLNHVGFYYRIRRGSMLRSLSQEKSDEILRYLSVKHSDFFVNQFGSFHELARKTEFLENHYNEKFKSEKFVINLFCKTFFGFSIFKNVGQPNIN